MDIVIITGASKGLGRELFAEFDKAGAVTYGLARTNPEQLINLLEVDLTDGHKAERVLEDLIDQHIGDASSFTLVNNAGMIEPIGLAGTLDPAKMQQAIEVNLTAPIQLTNTFIRKLALFQEEKKVLNISSGAGRSAYEGWSIYCTTKAGLDHFTRTVALEQQNAENPVGVISIAPGIIDTGMQEVIRSSSDEQFPHVEKFIDYKEEGQLSSASETAGKLARFIKETDFLKADPIADIRQVGY